jgi:hypothetical protein
MPAGYGGSIESLAAARPNSIRNLTDCESDTEVIMSYGSPLLAAVAAIAVSSTLHADPLQPIQAQKIELGALAGVAYYTVEPDGYRLVVTLAGRESDSPIRFVATLAPGQAVTLSAARNVGEPAVEVRFVRQGEQLSVNGGTATPQREARAH